MNTISAEQAAALLHVNVKRVQHLARKGRIPGVRVGRKWLFHRADLERMLGKETGETRPEGRPIELSARNQLRGRIVGLNLDGVMAEVRVDLGGQELVSIITRASAERMGLSPGDSVLAVIKSTEIMIGRS
jgi:molybdopterin-binding protein